MKRFWLVLLLAPGILVLSLSPSAAAQETTPEDVAIAEGHVEEEHHESPFAIVFRWINFIILFGGLGYLLRQPAAEFFETRREAIVGGLARARSAQGDADQRMRTIEEKLRQLSAEIDRIRADADATARHEQQRIVEGARAEVDQAVAQARAEVDRLARGMERQIRGQVADLVIERALERMRNQVTPADHSRIVRRAIPKL